MANYAIRASMLPNTRGVPRHERVAGRLQLAVVVKQLRRSFPNIEVNKAWVHSADGKNWDFHGVGKYFTVVQATNAYAARAKGWTAWLKMKGIVI